jgi:hypothetical protein
MQSWHVLVRRAFAAALACGACAFHAHAALVTTQYGDFNGLTRSYLGVVESSEWANPGPFGTPTIANNDTLLFAQTNNFFAEALGPGFSIDGLDSRLTFTVAAHQGSSIDTILFRESGVYSLSQPDLQSMAKAIVGNQIFFRITGVDGLPFAGVTIPAPAMTFVPEFEFTLQGPGDVAELPWSGQLLLDLTTFFPELAGRITSVEITLDNSVTALAMGSQGSRAFIEKRMLSVTVPEASSSIFLASAGLAAVLAGRLRRRMTLFGRGSNGD